DGRARARLPYSGELVGDPIRGVLHGGVITTLMDTTAGMAAFMALDGPTPLATLDLRIDYLTKATPEKDVIARAQVTRVTRSIVFVSGAAFHEEDQPIATCAATFMLHTTIRRTADSTRGTR
ncbi:MAG: PaaI family thioesterase, partial [Myxococcota bacterium]